MHRVYTEGLAVRVDRHAPSKRAARMGYGCSLTTPVPVRGRLWGVISVASVAPESLPADAERVLDDFAELIGLAVANTEAHAVLVEQAATDPLTAPGQPPGLPRAPARGALARACATSGHSRSRCSTSTTSRRSTTRSATSAATSSWLPSPPR